MASNYALPKQLDGVLAKCLRNEEATILLSNEPMPQHQEVHLDNIMNLQLAGGGGSEVNHGSQRGAFCLVTREARIIR